MTFLSSLLDPLNDDQLGVAWVQTVQLFELSALLIVSSSISLALPSVLALFFVLQLLPALLDELHDLLRRHIFVFQLDLSSFVLAEEYKGRQRPPWRR